jgi:hypothetical protein
LDSAKAKAAAGKSKPADKGKAGGEKVAKGSHVSKAR